VLDLAFRDTHHDIFEFGCSRDINSFPLQIREGAREAGAFVGIIEYMPSCDRNRVHRGDPEHIVNAVVARVIIDTRERRFYTAQAARPVPAETAKLYNYFIVRRNDVLQLQHSTVLQRH